MTMFSAPVPPAADEVARGLDIGRALIKAGVPLFVAPPCPPDCTSTKHRPGEGSAGGYHLPSGWQTSTPTLDVVDRWRPGWALCAVMGHAVDLLDVDPRNGGDETAAGLRAAGMWPTVYASASTPSGGTHDFVARLGVGSRDNVAPGLDIKAGTDGAGHGFAFIAPTIKLSKITNTPTPYRWTHEPDLDALDGSDDTGAALADLVRSVRGAAGGIDRPVSMETAGGGTFAAPTDGLEGHRGPIPDGDRHRALVAYAGRLRAVPGLTYPEAQRLMLARLEDCAQPPTARYPVTPGEALEKLADVWHRYPAPAAVEPMPSTPEEFEAYELAQATAAELRRQRARASAASTLRAEATAATPPPEFVPLPALLAEPDEEVRYRVDELWPLDGRVMLAAQAKAGKTTLRDNLVRCLVDGDLFLSRFEVEPIRPDATVVVLDVELSRGNLRRWLRGQGIAHPERVMVVPLRGSVGSLDLFSDESRASWAARIRAARGQVAILDCLGPVLAAFGLNEKENADVGRFLVAFEALLKEAGIDEAMVIHHMGHANERGRGASRLRDWPDAEWRLVKDDTEDDPDREPARYLAAKGRDVDLGETQLRYDAESHRLSTTATGTRQDAKAAKGMEPVLSYIAGNPGLSQNKIEQGLSGSVGRNEVRKAIALGASRSMIHVHPSNAGNQHFLPESCPRCATAPPAPLAYPAQHETGAPLRPLGGVAQFVAGSEDQNQTAPAAHPLFAAPGLVGCPCGRDHHSPGDMRACPRCGRRYHAYGARALRQCPHCTSGDSE